MIRLRSTTRWSAEMAALAILLRILLPGLHSHASLADLGAARATSASHVVSACGCGTAHDGFPAPSRDAARADSDVARAGVATCIAGEIELGSPSSCPPDETPRATPTSVAARAVPPAARIVSGTTVALPPSRAPPRTDEQL